MSTRRPVPAVGEAMRVTVVAGVAVGAVVAGGGGRLAMLALRLTSGRRVHGVVSDDGFVIGKVTLGGTYNLLAVGAAVGVIGAATYLAVAPRLIGPTWFRRTTTGLAGGAVGGAMLVHGDGVDFTLLRPTWLAVALFIALPTAFGVTIGIVVDAIRPPGSWTRRRPFAWLLPAAALAAFPMAIVAALTTAIVLVAATIVGAAPPIRRLRASAGYAFATRVGWAATAALGLALLLRDVGSVADATR